MVFTFGSASGSSKVLATPQYVLTEVNTAVPVGRAALKLLGGKEEEAKAKEEGGGFDESKIVIPDGITPQNLKNFTLYDILGFSGEIGGSADTEVIKRAYHRAVLKYHPDKAQYKTADGKEDRTVFLKIQEAFNVLSNEQKRRAYDSQLPFNDRVPTEEEVLERLAKGNHKFFKLYAPIFTRNARFAVKKPVPELGDMETPMSQVHKFYEYWVRFESWRDFTGVGAEYKPDDAQSREEKRYMQKENEKLAKKLKTKEMERLIRLVSIAQKFDPRIVAEKERIKQEKEKEKNEKEAFSKNKAEMEAAAQTWHDALEAADMETKGGSTKEAKEKFKKNMSKARNILRKLLRFSSAMGQGSGEYGVASAEEAELLCSSCTITDLKAMNDGMGGEPASKDQSLVQAAGFDIVKAKIEYVKSLALNAKEDEQITKDAKKRESEDRVVLDRKKLSKKVVEIAREWSSEELELLNKAIDRYRVGKPERWTFVANYMNVKGNPAIGSPFTAQECLLKAYLNTK